MWVCGACQVAQEGIKAPLESEGPVAASERLGFFMRRIGLSFRFFISAISLASHGTGRPARSAGLTSMTLLTCPGHLLK
jgi:hypothetical protein